MRYIFILCLLFFSSCKKQEKLSAEHTYPVRVEKVVQKDTPIFLQAIGHVESIHKIDIKSRIEGELTGVYFTQGDFVKKGDLLFTIDPRPYEAALKKAKATLEENLANLKLSKDKVLRHTTLVQEEYFSEIDFEQLKTDSENFDALVQQGQAEVENAKINLDYCWIYSPINGKTGILKIDQGNLVKAAAEDPLISVQQICPIFVTFSLSEKFFPLFQKREKGTLTVLASSDNFQKDVFEGKLFMIDNAVDENTGMIKLRGLFENDQKSLWPGLFVRTRLVLEVKKDAILIPSQAVEYTQKGPIVYVIKDSRSVEKRSVTLGQRENGWIIAESGVKENDEVVIDGLINLYEGAKVRIITKKECSHEPF